jgi:hypothetical protein
MFFPCLLLKAITMRLELFLSRRSNLEIPKRAYLVGTILTYLCTTTHVQDVASCRRAPAPNPFTVCLL